MSIRKPHQYGAYLLALCDLAEFWTRQPWDTTDFNGQLLSRGSAFLEEAIQ